MSIWINRKNKNQKPSIYSVSIPVEFLIIFLGLLASVFAARYIFNPAQFQNDSITITLLGFILFIISKISLFTKGIWNSWGSGKMKKHFKWLYRCGYFLMIFGIICMLAALKNNI